MHKSFLAAAAAFILTAPVLALASGLPAEANQALSSASSNAAAEDAAAHAALKVSFQLDHQYVPEYDSEDELSSVYQYRVGCRAYALTGNWAVMSGNCLNPKFHTKSDQIIIGGLNYDPEPVNIRLNGKISVAGQPVSTYYHTAQLTLLYAAPGTPLADVLARATKVNLRILNRPEEIFTISGGNFLVNGKKRSLKGNSLRGRNVELDEPWTTPTAGRASDAMFYVKNGRAVIAGFNNGKIDSVPNIELDLIHRWDECTREKSSSYYTLNRNDLKFIKNKTGRDWNQVGQHIFVSAK